MKAVLPPDLLNRGLTRGSVVRSIAGHDRGELFIVLKAEQGFAWLADGGRRSHGTPKMKRVTHVRSAGMLTKPSELDRIDALGDCGQRDAALRKLINEHISATPNLKEEV